MKAVNSMLKYFYALISSFYLFSLGVFSEKNRDLISTISFHFGFKKKPRGLTKPILPSIEISELLPEPSPAFILEPIYRRGNMSLLEIVVMDQLIAALNPQRLFEIGTFDGRTALNMAANCKPTAKVFTLDLPRAGLNHTQFKLDPTELEMVEKDQSGERYRGTSLSHKITQLYGDSAAFDFRPYFNTMDFVFIDASHAYEYVLNDSRQASKLLKNGKGFILWHDYGTFEGVTQALHELYSHEPPFKTLRHIKETQMAYLRVE